jgi:hypothetical protein
MRWALHFSHSFSLVHTPALCFGHKIVAKPAGQEIAAGDIGRIVPVSDELLVRAAPPPYVRSTGAGTGANSHHHFIYL